MTVQACFSGTQGHFVLDAAFEFPVRGVTALFGPSGCGKTTLLRCMAGLNYLPQGRFTIAGEVWQDEQVFLKPYQRSVGYVFQEASLFPHLSVRENLLYGARRCQTNTPYPIDFDELVSLLGILPLLDRSPARLSGGERQRIAIGRALLTQPRILLMDEPLSALDHQSKQDILPYLERLHERLSIPVVYVTHAIEEVARLADHIVLLEQGKVQAAGNITETLSRLDFNIRQDEHAAVVLPATIVEQDKRWHLARAKFVGGSLWVRGHGLQLNQSIRLRVLARDVSIGLHPIDQVSIQNRLPATITELAVSDDPAVMLLRLNVDGSPLLARLTSRSAHELRLEAGQRIWAQIKSVAVLE
ncbi:molybdenum ABC transporter ATP-binding protein [Gynuella sunshinyii]|uniref:ABC-type molybdate transport system, ATPase component n=1 Tax=Gynuella sunshinyii YC6258 TaxID=1445510 RepID=A0A0C5VFU7_9GAMM|nr:molybdenum ABC transporter ATP-binding protein [Gynuella sunshinyii]AJQ93071.1 ABC-type molybdate transport system, ATPase component [Gynuella sunshinyii YC6258]